MLQRKSKMHRDSAVWRADARVPDLSLTATFCYKPFREQGGVHLVTIKISTTAYMHH